MFFQICYPTANFSIVKAAYNSNRILEQMLFSSFSGVRMRASQEKVEIAFL